MSDEEAKQSGDADGQRGDNDKDQKRTPRKRGGGGKKVVSRIRDAKSDSSDRQPKEAPVEETRPDGQQETKEIKTIVEKAPEKDGRGGDAREERRKPGRGRRGGKAGGSSPRGGGSSEPVDPEELAKRAWKIFQSDVAEEGIALVDNATGRQLALRSFELARVFLEEQSRQRRLHGSSKDASGGDKRGDGDDETNDES